MSFAKLAHQNYKLENTKNSYYSLIWFVPFAILSALLGLERGLIKENPEQSMPSSNAKYYVQVGAYESKENAEKQLQKAKDAGVTDAFIRVVAQTNSRT